MTFKENHQMLRRTWILSTAAACTAGFLLVAQTSSQSDAEKAKARAAQKARNIALARKDGSAILNLYDRQGKIVATVKERAFYNQPTISPDKTRLAVIEAEPEKETQDIFVIDIATGKSIRITSGKPRETTR